MSDLGVNAAAKPSHVHGQHGAMAASGFASAAKTGQRPTAALTPELREPAQGGAHMSPGGCNPRPGNAQTLIESGPGGRQILVCTGSQICPATDAAHVDQAVATDRDTPWAVTPKHTSDGDRGKGPSEVGRCLALIFPWGGDFG